MTSKLFIVIAEYGVYPDLYSTTQVGDTVEISYRCVVLAKLE